MNSSNYPDLKQSLVLVFLTFAFFAIFFFVTGTLPQIFGIKLSEIHQTIVFTFASPIVTLPLIIYVSKKSGVQIKWPLKIPAIRIFLLLVMLAIAAKIITSPFDNAREYFINLFENRLKILAFNISEFRLSTLIRFIGIVLIVPIFEEIFWRKQILGLLLKKYSPVISIIVSSLLFALGHLRFNDIVSLFIWGLLFALVYYLTKSLESSILLHSLSNLSSFFLENKFVGITGLLILKYILILAGSLIVIFLIIRYFSKNFKMNRSESGSGLGQSNNVLN